jgi:hypothetical protein
MTISAVAGSVVAAGLVVGMLFEGWLDSLLSAGSARVADFGAVAVIAGLLYIGLRAFADAVAWTRAEPGEWVDRLRRGERDRRRRDTPRRGRAAMAVHADRQDRSFQMNALPQPVAAVIDAANANDTDAFLASLAPDAVVDDWGREFRGPDAIRGWSDREFIGVDVSLEVTGVEQTDGTTTVTATVGGKGFNGPSHFTFQVEEDRVSRMTIRA